MKRCCYCVLVMPRRILRVLIGQMRLAGLPLMGSEHGMLNAHLPLIMELMLWLMMRSAVLHCSADGSTLLSDAEDWTVAVIFGFALVHFAVSQG